MLFRSSCPPWGRGRCLRSYATPQGCSSWGAPPWSYAPPTATTGPSPNWRPSCGSSAALQAPQQSAACRQGSRTFGDSYKNQRKVLQDLVDSHIVPAVIQPLNQTITNKQ